MFDLTILFQYTRYYRREPADLDREAIKRYLTTDESWVQHRWAALRKKLEFPFTISFHMGPYRDVIEGVAPEEDAAGLQRQRSKDSEDTALLVRAASRSYGTQ